MERKLGARSRSPSANQMLLADQTAFFTSQSSISRPSPNIYTLWWLWLRLQWRDCDYIMPPPTESTSRSGIRKLSNGESVIPASTRADGSVRKEIRVKPGYKPPEDVEVYKNRTAEAWKNRGKGGVPGAAAAGEEEKLPPHKAAAAAAKNAKRREARKKAAAAGAGEDGAENANEKAETGKNETTAEKPEEVDPEAEKAKEARKLAKKLRQARELKDKKEQGDNLLPEQFGKVIKINELIRQLDNLGFDAEGKKKKEEPEEAPKTNEAAG